MSLSNFIAESGVIDQLVSNNIEIVQSNTPLQWNNSKKHKDILLHNNRSTAKLNKSNSGFKGVLSFSNAVIGTDTLGWSLTVYQDTTIWCGIAEGTKDLNTITNNGDLISTRVTVTRKDRIVLLLSTTELKVKHNNKTVVLDINNFIGKTMYPWISGIPDTLGYSVLISNYRILNISISDEGGAVINTNSAGIENTSVPFQINAGNKEINIVTDVSTVAAFTTVPGMDFSISTKNSNNGIRIEDTTGSVVIDTVLQVNEIQTIGSFLTISGGNTNTVIVDNLDNLIVDPGCVITESVKASVGLSTKIVNSSGDGVHITSSGNAVFDADISSNVITSSSGTDLSLLEGTNNLGLVISDITGSVTVTGTGIATNFIYSDTLLSIAPSNATSVEISTTGIVTEIKGKLDVLEGMDVTGNINTTGTINGVDISDNIGNISIHSDINIVTPLDNQLLQYNNANSEWVNTDISNTSIIVPGHTHTDTEITDVATSADGRLTVQKGAVNGLAELDALGKIIVSQLPISGILAYVGTWNADANSPALASGTGSPGNYYVVNVPGSTLIDGINEWKNGDFIVYNTTIWEKINNTNLIISVAGKQDTVTLQATDFTDITDSGSGAIITSGERTLISNLPTTYLALTGDTITGNIDMGTNNITDITDITILNDITVGNNSTVSDDIYVGNNCVVVEDIILGKGNDTIILSSGISPAIRSYDIQDKGDVGSFTVIKKTIDTTISSYLSDQTIVIPAGVNQIEIKLWGAGGQAGLNEAPSTQSGPGGGGGYSYKAITVRPGDVYQLTIGGITNGGIGGDNGVPGNGGTGGGMTMLHKLVGGMYYVQMVAGGGGGGTGTSSGIDGTNLGGGGGGSDGNDLSNGDGGKTPSVPSNGGATGVGAIPGVVGGIFVDPVASISNVNGNGGDASSNVSSDPSSGGGGDGYGGGGGASSGNGGGGGGGGGQLGDLIIQGIGTASGNNIDVDKQNGTYGILTAGTGGSNNFSVGASGAALVYLNTFTYSLSLSDNDIADTAAGENFLLYPANKILGTGNGGNLQLRGGLSPNDNGVVQIQNNTRFIPQAEPLTGESGSIYFDSTTNKLRVYSNSSWVDLY